jgi:ribonuclease VapC
VLAYLRSESGADAVREALGASAVSAVNLAEVHSVVVERGVNADRTTARLAAMGLEVEPFDAHDAAVVGALRRATRHLGLSLADRACLSLALRLRRPVLTADANLAGAEVGAEIILIR